MKRLAILLACALALGAFAPQSATACSWGYKRGHSPEEIKQRRDVFVTRGTFRFEEMRGTPAVNDEGEEILEEPEVIGRIERVGAAKLKTTHVPTTQIAGLSCIFPGAGPEADAKGTFWISERRDQGRLRILHWEGDYLQTDQTQTEPTD